MITSSDVAIDRDETDEATMDGSMGAAAQEARELYLGEIPLRREVELVRIDLPADGMVPLLERGLVPGCRLCPVRRSPTGDPILLVDGVLIALRREMAACLCVKAAGEATN